MLSQVGTVPGRAEDDGPTHSRNSLIGRPSRPVPSSLTEQSNRGMVSALLLSLECGYVHHRSLRLVFAFCLAACYLAWPRLGPLSAIAAPQTFSPAGEYSVSVFTRRRAQRQELIGAAGGANHGASASGGLGADVQATVTVPTGITTLYVEVGGVGTGVGGF